MLNRKKGIRFAQGQRPGKCKGGPYFVFTTSYNEENVYILCPHPEESPFKKRKVLFPHAIPRRAAFRQRSRLLRFQRAIQKQQHLRKSLLSKLQGSDLLMEIFSFVPEFSKFPLYRTCKKIPC